MEVDHHKGPHHHHLHIEWTKEEDEGLVVVSVVAKGKEVQEVGGDTLAVILWKYIVISV